LEVTPDCDSQPEITRVNGLGEISPKEFVQFIGKEMRLGKFQCVPKAADKMRSILRVWSDFL
jgi:hypothetical protein